MNTETLGQRIKRLREDRDMTQGDLMREARNYIPEDRIFSRATLSRIENDQHNPTSWALDAIATALGVRTDYLLDRTQHDTLPQPAADIAQMVGDLNRQPPNVRAAVKKIVDQIIQLATDAFSVQPNESSVTLESLREMIDTFPPAEQEVLLSAISRLREKQRQAEERKRQRQSDEDDVSNFGT